MEEEPANSAGKVAGFERNFLDPTTPITRIGEGELGGKARGLVFIRDVLNESFEPGEFAATRLAIPSLAVICSGVFDAFMERNDLYKTACADLPEQRISHAFQQAELPFEVLGDLRAIVDSVHRPLAVRSSSLLEDQKQEPFAGIYATKMIPNNQYDPDIRFRQLVEAIKFVYASTYSRNAKNYRKATGHPDSDEKMAVIVQEIVGKRYHERFYPELSGVARSYNYYPFKPAIPQDGVVNLALGLGKIIVDGGISWTYSPSHTKATMPYGSVQQLLKESQTIFWSVNMGELKAYDPINETEYLLLENIQAAEKDQSLRYLASTYSPHHDRLSIGVGTPGARVLNFAPLLVLEQAPLNPLIRKLLSVCQEALGGPVEIEFAMTFDPNYFGFLQVRSMVVPKGHVKVSDSDLHGEQVLVGSNAVLGNGIVEDIQDVVYIKPESFELKQTRAIVPELEALNKKLLAENRPYLLIVFGRLGTSDPWLGIPVNWGQVSKARVIVEATQSNARVELSQGSHFFHNIINLGVKYFSLAFVDQHFLDWDWLNSQDVIEETRYLRHIRTAVPLETRVDGRSGRGVILKG
jgi:hypothetical protein